METIRKVYLSLNLFSVDVSIGRTVNIVDPFDDCSYPGEVPRTIVVDTLTKAFAQATPNNHDTILLKPRDVASKMIVDDMLEEGKKLYKKLSKKKSSSSYYKRKKIAEQRRYNYKHNIGGLRDRILEAGRKHREKIRREKAMAKATNPF